MQIITQGKQHAEKLETAHLENGLPGLPARLEPVHIFPTCGCGITGVVVWRGAARRVGTTLQELKFTTLSAQLSAYNMNLL